MPIGRPKTELVLNEDERVQLSSLAGSRSLPHALVARAKVILWSAEGASNTKIADRLEWTKATVGKWRRRFLGRRVQGLYDELRSGRPRSIEDEQVAALLKRTLSRKQSRNALDRSGGGAGQWNLQIHRTQALSGFRGSTPSLAHL